MKTDTELATYLQNKHDTNKFVPGWRMHNMGISRNIMLDFAEFTRLQGGGKSNDLRDKASANFPPKPDKDGKYYHTVDDVTWSCFQYNFKSEATPARFYKMSKADRRVCILHFKNIGRFTASPAINCLLSYIAWGSGGFYKERVLYKIWYESDFATDCINNELVVFNRLMDIRLYRFSTMADFPTYGNGWISGSLIFWDKFKFYCKS